MQAFVRFAVSSLFPNTPSLLVQDTTFNPSLPIAFKLGDANLDGFPDLLAITVSGKDHIPNLVFSVPCAKGVPGCVQGGAGRRGWSVANTGVKALELVKDARSLTFLDLDEDVGLTWLIFFFQSEH